MFIPYQSNKRLTLCRKLPSVEAAIAFARNHQRARFRPLDDLFVVDELTGEFERASVLESSLSSGDLPETSATVLDDGQAIDAPSHTPGLHRAIPRQRALAEGTASRAR